MLRSSLRSPRFRPGLGVFLSLACALAAALTKAPFAEAATFTKGPYLQALGQTEVTIQLELSLESPASEQVSIAISGPGGLTRTVSAPSDRAGGLFHRIRVDNLTPATTYEYVATFGEAKSEKGRFTTAPPDNRPFRFILYGDNRTDHAAHAAVIRAIEATPSDFLLHTGDMVHKGNNPADWQAFFDIERALLRDRCVFAAVGNHELTAPDPSGEMAFLRYFFGGVPSGVRDVKSQGDAKAAGDAGAKSGSLIAPLYRSFRWSNTRFFLLNAMDSWTGDDRRWLDEELERSLGEEGLVHRIAVLHHGPFSSGPHGANKRLAAGNVVDLLRERRVSLVVAGHDHAYERGFGGGLRYIVSGGGGAPLYARKTVQPETLTFESVHHFVEIAVDGDRVETVARRASGTIIERCSFRGLSPWICGESATSPSIQAPPPTAKAAAASSCACATAGAPPSQDERQAPAPLWASLSLLFALARRRARNA